MKIDPQVKLAFKKMVQQLKDPVFARGVVRVETRLLESYEGEAIVREFKFLSDERPESGGNNKGPTPLEYFLAGYAFCQQTIFVRHAAAVDLHLDDLQLTVRGYFDRRGVYGTADVDPSFQEVVTEMKITSQEGEERVREAITRVHRHCPAYNTLKKALKINEKFYLNGKIIELG